MISTPLQGLADLIFPPSCLLCSALLDQPHKPICSICFDAFEPIAGTSCQQCGQPLLEVAQDRCLACTQQEPPLTIRSAFAFGGPLGNLIIDLKHGKRDRAKLLAALLMEAQIIETDWKLDLLIPVPLHKTRRRKRGFNQAELIGRTLAKNLNLRFRPNTLERLVNNQPQTQLQNRTQRRDNVRGVFHVSRPAQTAQKNVLLIDDVVTTGATLTESARALLQAGANRVYAVTLARTILA